MTDTQVSHVPSIPSAREIREKVREVQLNCRKRLLDEWQFERAYACLQVLKSHADHEAVRDARVRLYPDGEERGGYSYDGTHCIIRLRDGEWKIDTYRSGTHDRMTKDVAAILEVPVSDSEDPEAARELREHLKSEGWAKGSGSEMRIYTGDMSQ